MRSRIVLFAFLAVLVLLGGGLIAASFMEKRWSMETRTSVQAPASAVDALLSTPGRWPEWFPWSKVKAPDIVYTTSGPAAGVGASLAWTSTNLGQGRLTLTKSDPTGVAYTLVISGFGEFPIHGEIQLQETAGVTVVSVKEGGELGSNPMMRLFRGVLEGKLKLDYDGALVRLKAIAEGRPPPPEAPPRTD
jgi:hypothetical protein